MNELKPVTLFATPDSLEDLQGWIADASDVMVTTAAMMMYNYLVTNYNFTKKEGEE